MTMMGKTGRPPLGVEHVERLDGPGEEKRRLKMILETVTGAKSVEEACAELKIAPAHFHRLRDRALSGALSALASKPGGRPTKPPVTTSREQQLERELREVKIDLRAAQLREELALVMPHLLKQKKTNENDR
jgi:hypothetical protein